MPRPYVRPMPATWWLRNRAYFWFMMREFTAIFVAIYCVALIWAIWRIKEPLHGGERYDEIVEWLQSSTSILLHFLALLAAMYHTVTWFNLVPRVLVVRLGEEKLPPSLLIAAHWILWLIVTAGLLWLVFR